MSRSRDLRIVVKIAGIIGAVAFAASAPFLSATGAVAQSQVICIPPQHNDPWIGCTN